MAPTNSISPFLPLFDGRRADSKPAKAFVVGRRTLTYGELFDRTARLATLYRRLGLARDDRCVVCSDDDIAVITVFFSLLRNGITAVIVNPRSTAEELRSLVAAADAKALIADADILARSDAASALPDGASVVEIGPDPAAQKRPLLGWLTGARPSAEAASGSYPALLDGIAPAKALPADIPDSTVAYILFTSGTTSRPKGVEITHRNLFAHMSTLVRHYGFDEATHLLNVLPLFHADGLMQGPVVAFTAGASVFRPMRFRVDRLPALLDSIYASRITHFVAVPTILALIANLDDDYDDSFLTDDFRFVISTAAYLDKKLWADFEDRFRTQVTNVYGLTETVCESLYCGPSDETRRLGTVGKPVDCETRIVDELGRDVPPGETGELILRAAHIMKGYFRMPEETAQVLRDGWLFTGDLARLDKEGFYHIVGRKKDVIIRGGMNVYPEDVTGVLRRVPGVVDAVTFGMEDPTWGERVVSCVVPAADRELTVDEIAERFLEHASREMLPSEIHVLDDLPRGPAGKAIIAEVKRIVGDRRAPAAGGKGDAIGARVLSLAAQSFKARLEDLSEQSNPETLRGWTSLAHVDFILAIETELGIKLTPREVMSIKRLGNAIEIVRRKVADEPARLEAV
jgi:long-chain acyl-CoA synthetase